LGYAHSIAPINRGFDGVLSVVAFARQTWISKPEQDFNTWTLAQLNDYTPDRKHDGFLRLFGITPTGIKPNPMFSL
jgi:hypothetical protein